MKLFEKDWYRRKYLYAMSLILPKSRFDRLLIEDKMKRNFLFTFHRKLNLRNPKDFNEKLLWLALYWQHPLKTLCADKVKIHDYVKECGLSQLLIPILHTYNHANEIDFAVLPPSFVLKCNHGCGYNIIVPDKKLLNIDDSKILLDKWLAETYGVSNFEFHYADIHPHKILCEQFLPSLDDNAIIDFKIHCFSGKPDFFLVCYNRIDGEAKLITYSLDWKRLYYVIDEEDDVNIQPPSSLKEMVEYATILAKPFPFVRVDFYELDNKPLIGELTFTPYGNMITYYTKEVLDMLGKRLKLPKKYKEQEL